MLFNEIMKDKSILQEDTAGMGDDPGDQGPIVDPLDTPTLLHPKLQAMVDALTKAVPSLK